MWLFMDGFSIMNFAIKRVPKSISNVSVCVKEKIDRYYLHQANKFMIDYLVKKMKIDKSLVSLQMKLAIQAHLNSNNYCIDF